MFCHTLPRVLRTGVGLSSQCTNPCLPVRLSDLVQMESGTIPLAAVLSDNRDSQLPHNLLAYRRRRCLIINGRQRNQTSSQTWLLCPVHLCNVGLCCQCRTHRAYSVCLFGLPADHAGLFRKCCDVTIIASIRDAGITFGIHGQRVALQLYAIQ